MMWACGQGLSVLPVVLLCSVVEIMFPGGVKPAVETSLGFLMLHVNRDGISCLMLLCEPLHMADIVIVDLLRLKALELVCAGRHRGNFVGLLFGACLSGLV